MATGHAELVCFLKGREVTKLDFRNSDLTSIDSLTYSSTLGLICSIETHGCGMAEVVKNQGTGLVRYAMKYRANFLDIFVGVARWLGSPD